MQMGLCYVPIILSQWLGAACGMCGLRATITGFLSPGASVRSSFPPSEAREVVFMGSTLVCPGELENFCGPEVYPREGSSLLAARAPEPLRGCSFSSHRAA